MCWRIKRLDNVIRAFTEHDDPIAWDGDTYTARLRHALAVPAVEQPGG
jgi:hypothetical protein